MFTINKSSQMEIEYLDNSPIYTMNNFYEYPEKVIEYLSTNPSFLHKDFIKPSFNGKYFEDRRQQIDTDKANHIYDMLSRICGQKPLIKNVIMTNIFTFKDIEFNDYKNNYWWPHKDSGFTGIVYFNDDQTTGTNLYKNISDNPKGNEHYEPWRSKDKWELIHTLKSGFNKFVMFDGKKFFHGMKIENDIYSDKGYRVNQVFFFREG